jgi:hypothetical protein
MERVVAVFWLKMGEAARAALEKAGIRAEAVREVVVQRLQQAVPGQLGKICRRMAESGVNIEVLYSDHDHQLILVVDDFAKGSAVSGAWTENKQQAPRKLLCCGVREDLGLSSVGRATFAPRNQSRKRTRPEAIS